MKKIDRPKVFISYAWGTQEYQTKVLAFATSLMQDGVDVLLDKWSAMGGNDLNSFMEKSVNDSTVTNVLMLLDENYSKKADQRKGGVGTETQIISQQVYQSVEQSKFIPVVFERDQNGHINKPIYLKSRFHYDLSDNDSYDEEYKKLVRHLFGVETYRKPSIGNRPAWIDEQIEVSTKSLVAYDELKRIQGEIRGEKFLSFLDDITERIISFTTDRVRTSESAEEYIEAYAKSISIRKDYLSLVERAVFVDNYVEHIADFFENTYNRIDTGYTEGVEQAKVFLHEIFLYTIAYLIKKKKYIGVGYLLGRTYFLKQSAMGSAGGNSFVVFYSIHNHDKLDKAVRKRDNKKYHSGTSAYWMETLASDLFSKEDIVAADELCFNYAIYGCDYLDNYLWFPITYVYGNDYNSFIGILAKQLISREKVGKILPMFNYSDIEQFRSRLKEVENGKNCKDYHRYRYMEAFESPHLLGNYVKSDEIGTVR